MKSLLDIQQDIRNLENTLNDISDSVKNINLDIEDIRSANSNTDVDYSKIQLLAKQLDFGKHPISKLEDGRACQVYLEMLLNIVRLDLEAEVVLNRLVFIQWIQVESRIDWSLEDLFKDCYKMDIGSYHEMVDVIPKKYRENLVVDALIIANLSGASNIEIREYVADVVTILGIDKDRLKILSFIARVALCQSVGRIKKAEMDKFQKSAKAYRYYIKADILEQGIKSMRQIIVQLPDSETRNFKWKVKQGQSVRKEEVIATYSREAKKEDIHFQLIM